MTKNTNKSKVIVQVEDRPEITLGADEKLATGFDGRLQIAVQQHSPLPWHIGEGNEIESHKLRHPGISGLQIVERAANATSEANAKLIVASVNHSAQLAEALRELRTRIVATGPNCLNTTKADEALAAYEADQ